MTCKSRKSHISDIIQLPTQPYLSSVLYCYLRMYCAFRNAERLRCLSDRGVVVDDIACYPNSSFFNIVFQRKTTQDTFLQCMKVSDGLCTNYVYLFILFIFLRIACQYILSFSTLITVTVVPSTTKKIKYVL